MAEVTLTISGRQYNLHCGDGDENHLFHLAELVEEKAAMARNATPGLTEVRQLLFAALFLADELHDLRTQPQKSVDTTPSRPSADIIAALTAQAEESARARISAEIAELEERARIQAETEQAMAEQINHLTNRIDALTDRLAGSIAPA
ncbi:MAG: cell division protein ZapA [Sphingobium sp.]|nr:cell division protein ZapA [Sphingobium sp.]